jgi:arginyl-tRNA synthetase
MLETIKKTLKLELEATLSTIYSLPLQVVIEEPKRRDQGDLSIPVFVISKALLIPLPDALKQVISALENSSVRPLLSKIFTLGGFVNLFLDKLAIAKEVIHQFKQPDSIYHANRPSSDKVVCIDYSSPNIAKPFSIGHLRSTIIGHALGNIFEKLGTKVVRINHLGDFGTQFGKTIYAYLHFGDKEAVSKDPINELVKLYVEFNERAKSDPSLDVEARRIFKELELGNEEYNALWQWMRDASLRDYMEVYQLLDVSFDSYAGEAFYNDKMQPIIDDLTQKGLLVEDDGAMIVDLGEQMPPALIQKTDGSTLYITRDLAALFYRKETYHFDECLYVVGNEQRLHFEQIKAVIDKMGYDFSPRVKHINFGLVLQDGKKMSTRKGKIVKLLDVLTEAIRLSLSYIEEKNPDLEDKELIAQRIGVSAVVFNDLKNYRSNDFEFDLEGMVKFEGQTGPYLQYTSVRIQSILQAEDFEFDGVIDVSLFDDELYFEMIKQISIYQAIIQKAAEEYAPSVVAKYLLHLASLFNTFYGREKIMVENVLEKNTKKHLLSMVRAILNDGMKLLGMQIIEKM